MTASFPWYDLPWVQWANDAIWAATGLGGALDRLTPVDAQWRCETLVVSQACGLDLFLSGAPIEPVLAPVFDLDCEAGWYYSYLVGCAGGTVAAVNGLSSRSGLSALLTCCGPDSLLVTGSHLGSLAALRDGLADVACIDAVTWHIIERHGPQTLLDVPILARTSAAPAPPYVMRRHQSARRVITALGSALSSPITRTARRALGLRGATPVTRADYIRVHDEYRRIAQRIPPVLPMAHQAGADVATDPAGLRH